MGTLAKAPTDRLEKALEQLEIPHYSLLRAPETGLVMARGRAGGTGQRFNLGEVTVTRCAVKLDDNTVGHAYVAGRDQRKAEIAALFDALLQTPDHHQALQGCLIQPLVREAETAQRATAQKAAATRVEFFTMAREDNR